MSSQSLQDAVARNSNWINSLITNSKLPSELVETLDLTASTEVSIVQEGDQDTKKVKIPLLRGFKGNWNSTTNSPELVDGVGLPGDVYTLTSDSTRNLGSGNIIYLINDLIYYNGSIWVKLTQSQISEIVGLQTALDTLQENIDAEAITRGNADTTLQTNINTLEISLEDQIQAEQILRASADTALQNNIDLKVDIASIVDNVTSGGVSVPLSAEQGKILKAEILALAGSLIPQGNWNADTNTPDISGTTETGYYWIVSVSGSTDLGGETDWKENDWAIKTASGWAKIDNTDKVISVAGKIGEVVLAKADVGLSNVDNTTDANKPISTAQQTALDLKANKASPSFTGNAYFAGLVTINNRLDLSDSLNNTFIGNSVGENNTTGNRNVALGFQSLKNNTTGNSNIALGYLNLQNNTTGSSNAALGQKSLQNNTTGSGNVALGFQNLQNNTTGNRNVALGFQSLQNNTTGNSNVALGYLNLYENTTGSYNVALGYLSLQNNTTGSGNVALGLQSGRYIADGNTSNETGSESIFIGRDTRANADGETNQIVIGVNAIGNGSNTVTLGNSSITDNYFQGNLRASNFIGDGSALTNMPVSSAQQTALDLKANKNSPSFTGNATFGGLIKKFSTDSATEHTLIDFRNPSFGVYLNSKAIAGKGNDLIFKADDYNGGTTATRDVLALSPDGNATFGGNVGIGVASDSDVKLKILKTGSSFPTLGTSSGNLLLTDSGLWGMYMGVDSSTGSGWIQQMRNDTATAYALGLNPAGGNVLIGTTTDDGYKLDVNGTFRATGNATFGGNVEVKTNNSEITPTFTIENDSGSKLVLGVVRSGAGTSPDTSYLAYDNDFRIIQGVGSTNEVFSFDGSGNATFGGSVTASSFVGTIQENFTYLTTTHTLTDANYNLNQAKTDGESTVTIPTGLSTNRSWGFSATMFNLNLTEASGVTITVIANSNNNDLIVRGGSSARLVATATANEFLLIK